MMQIMTLKATTWGAFWVDVIWNFGIFPQFKYQIVSYARDFPPVKFFFLIVTLKTLTSSYRKMYREPMK